MNERIKVSKLVDIANALFNAERSHREEWHSVVKKVMPHIYHEGQLNHYHKKKRERVCSRAAVAVRKLASAHMSHITPMESNWFRYDTWNHDATPDEKHWFVRATDITLSTLARSNFYTELLGVYIDRVATGTGAMYVGANKENNGIAAKHIPSGTFAVGQDSYHQVDTFVRKFVFTPAQLESQFGYENLSPRIQQDCSRPETRYSGHVEVWHLVMPRSSHLKGFRDIAKEDMPWAEYFFDPSDNWLFEEGGHYEFPYLVTRFIRNGNQVYGTTPLLEVEDVIEDLRVFDESAKITAQRAAIPSVLLPPEMVGQVDFRAGGQTVVPIQYINSQVPKEFAPPVNANIIEYQRENMVKEIDDALFIPMLEVVSSVDRTMSATEVVARQDERIMSFTQSFTQHICDMRPIMNRIFAVMMRCDLLPVNGRPRDVLITKELNGFLYEELLNPKISYNGKMAQGLERNQLGGASVIIPQIVELSKALQNPRAVAVFNLEEYARMQASVNGVPSSIIHSPSEVKRMMEEVQQQQSAQQQAEQERIMSEANRNNAQAQHFLR